MHVRIHESTYTHVHCNTLQHTYALQHTATHMCTATHCNMYMRIHESTYHIFLYFFMIYHAKSEGLSASATHCKTMRHSATHCNTLWYTTQIQRAYQPLQHTAKQSITLQHTAIHCKHTLNTLQTHCKHTANTLQTHCKRTENTQQTHCNRTHKVLDSDCDLPCEIATHTATRCSTALQRYALQQSPVSAFFDNTPLSTTSLRCTATRCKTLQHKTLHRTPSSALFDNTLHVTASLQHTTTHYNITHCNTTLRLLSQTTHLTPRSTVHNSLLDSRRAPPSHPPLARNLPCPTLSL